MRVTLLPSGVGPNPTHLFTSILFNESVVIDAGCLQSAGDLSALRRIKHIFITHSHMDHLASLPPFLDAVYDGSGDCVKVYGNAHVLECLQKDLFNNRLYPDFLHISTFRPPYLRLIELTEKQSIEVNGLRLTPVGVNHVVPTFGYLVEDASGGIVVSSDTGPTEAIWKVAQSQPHLHAVFLECSFPDEMAWLADLAKHLTPSSFEAEMKKMRPGTRFIAVHLHARMRNQLIEELKTIKGVEIGVIGHGYDF